MTFVLDSSVSLSWCFEDEFTDATDALMERTGDSGAIVPSHWALEVLNGLAMAERRRRIDSTRRRGLIEFLGDLPVTIDPETVNQVWTVTSQLAAKHRLTVYDAAYLELAQRLGLPLATLDQELRAAADAIGVPLLGA